MFVRVLLLQVAQKNRHRRLLAHRRLFSAADGIGLGLDITSWRRPMRLESVQRTRDRRNTIGCKPTRMFYRRHNERFELAG